METILVFTNQKELARYIKVYLVINETSKLKQLLVTNKKQIILSFDEIDIPDIQSLIDLAPIGNVYILHHSKPNNAIVEELKNKLIAKGVKEENISIKESAHTNANTYGLIKNIPTNGGGEGNKVFEEFKQVIGGITQNNPRKKVLERCLVKEGVETLPKTYIDALSDADKQTFNEFKEKVNDLTDKEYSQEFYNLTQKWLGNHKI